jgi:hypothetical protein
MAGAGSSHFITPQTLSSQLKLLEDRMGVALLTGSWAELTDGRLARSMPKKFLPGGRADWVIHEFLRANTEFQVGLTDTDSGFSTA